jgi:formylglycine-generating enzyme required for sulfatase activity
MPQYLRWQSTTRAFIEPLAEGQALTMLRIPAGRFVMGSPDHESGRDDDEGPLHEVELQEFLMASTPITQAQWGAVMSWQPGPGETWEVPLSKKPDILQNERAKLSDYEIDTSQDPMDDIGWDEAMEFCLRLAQHTRRNYTLPSESQWEYACRAGSTTPYAFGSELTADLANFNQLMPSLDPEIYQEVGYTGSAPVRRYPANAWGLHDTHGNVWEWCLDHWHSSYSGAPSDGTAWIDADAPATTPRVLRGGSWDDSPADSRSACRRRLTPKMPDLGTVGLRVVCLPGGVGKERLCYPA